MEQLQQITESVSAFLWGWPMIILLLGTHLFLTIRLRFPQRKIFTTLAAFGIGNTVQANSISLLINESFGISTHITGIVHQGIPTKTPWCFNSNTKAFFKNVFTF